MPITDKRIGVLMGGTSAEREVSIKSGTAVLNALKGLRYNAVAIDAGPDICEAIRTEGIKIAFLVLHGGHGEDGSIQGLLEVLGVPYTGSGVLASALAMDKEASKKVFLSQGIPVPPFKVVRLGSSFPGRKSETVDDGLSTIEFSLPWVIKPATEGSSIGVNIVKDEASLNPALETALTFGGRVIIEKYIGGKEIQVGILNEKVLGSVEVRPKREFYSYEAKYTAGLTEYILPPEIPSNILSRAERIALSAHMALGCRGATRVDLILDGKCDPYVLEVNTIPGMTETSLLPKIAGLSGLSFPSLIEEILREALSGGRET
jgi:D-alanine-D-alanine ligase